MNTVPHQSRNTNDVVRISPHSLLVSDGVTLHLSDDTLVDCLSGSALVANVQQIFDEVMAEGAEDNFSTVVIAFIKKYSYKEDLYL